MTNVENITALKKQRAVIKGSCTRTRTYVDSLVGINPSIIAQLEERKLKLEQCWSEYNSVQTRLELVEEAEANDRAPFEEAFYALSAKIRELLNSTRTPRSAATSPASVASSHETSDTLTHRFQYLRASLTGDASNVINSLEISEANYEVAWTLLKQRYDNKRVIVQNHIKAIMDLPSMTKENYTELRHIADGATRHLHALLTLRRPTNHWDDLLVHILSSKIDSLTLREWQSSLTGTEIPTLKQFFDFITHRCQMLEVTNKSNVANLKGTGARSNVKRQSSCVATIKTKCNYCQREHSIYYCKEFLTLPIPRRISEIRSRQIYFNCLRSTTYNSSKCTSGNCKICQAKHNTLLHAAANPAETYDREKSNDNSKPANTTTVLATHTSNRFGGNHIMLSTAIVCAYDSQGSRKSCRVLLDCGSQANFVSRKFLTILGLKPWPLNVAITGVSGIAATATQAVQVKLESRQGSYAATVECIVADRVTDKLPACTLKRIDFEFPHNIRLADPQFYVSSEIDLLIGVELFWDLMCVGQIQSSPRHPLLQKTRLGWILAGRLGASPQPSLRVHACHTSITNTQLHDQLKRFWRLDDPNGSPNNYTLEENVCEEHFLNNVSQTPQGRYMVKLPIKEPEMRKLGDSRSIALNRLKGLERRFQRDPTLKFQYSQFIEEYLALGHMRRVHPPIGENSVAFYLPHHCVFKETSQGSKLRVVFDAFCSSTSGTSLNDVLMIGPVVQPDLTSVLLRFRTFIYVFSANMIKMYRQILIDPSQACLQRILWRNNPKDDVITYELTTITYGTSSASYLATRAVKHLAEQNASKFPVVIWTTSSRVQTPLSKRIARDQIIQLLRLGCFELSNWASNCPRLIETVDKQNSELVRIGDDVDASVLGVQWSQSKDIFSFSYKPDLSHNAITKRTILSEMARLFDPLGFLGPTIVVAKLIIQDLWQSGVHWDESVPQDLHTRWSNFKSQLNIVDQLQVPQGVKSKSSSRLVQLHGFCDASQRAYGACVYFRTKVGHDEYRSELLCSKSRVAPLKAVSLPRLELSAALLLARLMDKIGETLDLANTQIFLWSDSTITLTWISSPSRRWSVFVANRVGEIQRLTEIDSWRHVGSSNNPADILSRGLDPRELAVSSMWWHGPSFLQLNDAHWPSSSFPPLGPDVPEQKKVISNVVTIEQCIVSKLLNERSNLSKICRIIAYCLRFYKSRRPSAPTEIVSPAEITFALCVICKSVQKQVFATEYKALSQGELISASSGLLPLSPFLDEFGLTRVGGRLKNSNLQFETRHPILLPHSHDLTRLVIEHEHARNMHAGAQATMSFIRQRFWPLSLRSAVRKVIQRCVTCFKAEPRQSKALMGSLPASRITVSRPFSHSGVDYAGPVILREGKRRNARNYKAYVAIFVCFATKAVHVELVSDLTSDAFLAAFKRFISRRSKPTYMYSDNGTTFVGAHNQLKELYDFYLNQQTQHQIKQFCASQEVSWSFIPPNAPHFGGLWEAAVKSAKFHMNRIVGRAHLTFEELQTVLCEIEAILNSRPLTQLSADSNDLAHLTPGHFLIGTALNGFPCRDFSDVNENRLVRWQRVEQIRQHFWRRWSDEYLHSLQERSKWKVSKGIQLMPNQLVLIKEPNLAPLQWTLGHVQEVHLGSDDIARTATIRTARGSFVRPLARISILPINSSL